MVPSDGSFPDVFPLQRAAEILHPHVPDLLRSIHDAMSEWNSGLAPYHAALDATARATVLNRLIYFNATRFLAGKDVRFGEDQNEKHIIVSEALLLRVKLLDSRLERRNYPTKRAKAWVRQGELKGLEPLPRHHLGYRLDLTGTVLKDIFITQPNGRRTTVNQWVWQVWGESIEPFGVQRSLFANETFRYDDYSQAI